MCGRHLEPAPPTRFDRPGSGRVAADREGTTVRRRPLLPVHTLARFSRRAPPNRSSCPYSRTVSSRSGACGARSSFPGVRSGRVAVSRCCSRGGWPRRRGGLLSAGSSEGEQLLLSARCIKKGQCRCCHFGFRRLRGFFKSWRWNVATNEKVWK